MEYFYGFDPLTFSREYIAACSNMIVGPEKIEGWYMKLIRKHGLTSADVVMFGILPLIALVFALCFRPGDGGAEGAMVLVTIDGEKYDAIPLERNGKYEIVQDGNRNCFFIASGMVRMAEASCPDGLCVNHKAIGRVGETIVCLPNRVVLAIQGSVAREYDAITGSI